MTAVRQLGDPFLKRRHDANRTCDRKRINDLREEHVDRMQPGRQLYDRAEVSAAAALTRPQQVGVFILIGRHDVAGGCNNFQFENVIAGKAVQPRQPAEPTGGAQPGEPDGRARSGRHRHARWPQFRVQRQIRQTGSERRPFSRSIRPNVGEIRHVDDQPGVRRESGKTVAAVTHCEAEPVFPRELDGLRHVVGICDEDDRNGKNVGKARVPRLAFDAIAWSDGTMTRP